MEEKNQMSQEDQRLLEVLQDREDNYILPFYWQHGNHLEEIPEQMQRIYDCGVRAVCVESRPHPDFCGVGWWQDLDCILEEAAKRALSGDLNRYRYALPEHFRVTVAYQKHYDAAYASHYFNTRRLDAHTVEFCSDDYEEVLRFFHFVL